MICGVRCHSSPLNFSINPDPRVELERLSVSVDHQRKGIGSKLMEEWLKSVDEDGRALYITASKKGYALYQKFGCKEMGVLSTDLKEFGAEPYVNWNMVRVGKR